MTTTKPAPVPAVKKPMTKAEKDARVAARQAELMSNPAYSGLMSLKEESYLGRLVVVKTDKMPVARVGIVSDTDYDKGRGVGNTYLTIMFNDGSAITIDWRQGGYKLRLATGADFVGMFPQIEDEMMPDCAALEAPSVEASGESIEDMLAEVAGLNEAHDIPEIVVEDSSLPNLDF
jgi:hypothetical protein